MRKWRKNGVEKSPFERVRGTATTHGLYCAYCDDAMDMDWMQEAFNAIEQNEHRTRHGHSLTVSGLCCVSGRLLPVLLSVKRCFLLLDKGSTLNRFCEIVRFWGDFDKRSAPPQRC